MGLRVGQTSKCLAGLLGCSSRGSKPPSCSLGLGSLLGACILAASPLLSLYSLLFFSVCCENVVWNCLFSYDLPLNSGYGPSHDLLLLQLCHTFKSIPQLLSEITASKMLVLVLPACMLLTCGENRVFNVNTEITD